MYFLLSSILLPGKEGLEWPKRALDGFKRALGSEDLGEAKRVGSLKES